MTMSLSRRGLAAFAAAVALTFALPLAAPVRAAEPVLIFAAASLKGSLDAAAAAWSKTSGDEVKISYAASSALARQVEQGAPADLFISADLDWMSYLETRNLVAGTPVKLLGNRIVLVAPKDSTVTATIAKGFDLAGLLAGGRLAMGDPAAVPAGKYGKAALEALGIWASVADKVAAAENVRAALVLVARGEAPLGIVYATDAAADPAVKVVGTFPADSHPPIVYPAAVLKDAPAPEKAAALLAFLRGPVAHEIFAKAGFTVLD